MKYLPKLLLLFLLTTTTLCSQTNIDHNLWRTILGPSQAKIPADPGGKVVWRTDFQATLKEARSSNKPLLVTWRCLPCKQCAEFDKQVLDGSYFLNPLLRRFVTVRMTDAAQLDERYFPYKTHQDLDLSWWAYFLSPEGNYYGVFGGKDHVSDTTRISEAAFINSLQRVLNHHYDGRSKAWRIDLPAGTASRSLSTPKDTRGYKLLKDKYPNIGKPHAQFGACIHCHQVGDMQNLEAMESGTFTVEKLTGKWPLPENVGIYLNRDDGLKITKVVPGSPAAAAGLRAGDSLRMANATRLFGQADFRGVLHRASYGQDSIQIAWKRNDQVQFGTLKVQPGWRKINSAWRKTVYDGVYGPGMGFFPLNGPKAGRGNGLSVKPWMGRPPNKRPVYQTGLRPHMEIIAINGMNKDLPTRELITWFRLNHKPGEEVTYTVRGGKKYKFVLPKD